MFITSATTRLKDMFALCVLLQGKMVLVIHQVDCAENNAENFGGGVDISPKSLIVSFCECSHIHRE